jgi:SWI/SNF-related matrix-associated actin-dependent regulator 1 of chromatin subfamily A
MTQLLPHQVIAADFLAARKTALLADGMRVGKTPAAIGGCDRIGAKDVLWLTRGAARIEHAKAWQRFQTIDRPIKVIESRNDRPVAGVTICSYDLAAGSALEPLRRAYDVVVLDECFPAGVLVETALGPIPIDRIVNERLDVRVLSQGRHVEHKRVTRFIRKLSRETVRVQHEAGALFCTPNHKIWTENRGYVAAGEIRAGDVLRALLKPVLQDAPKPAQNLLQQGVQRPGDGREAALGGTGAQGDGPQDRVRVVPGGFCSALRERQDEILRPVVFGAMAMRGIAGVERADDQDARGAERRPEAARLGADEATEFRSGISRQTGCAVETAERKDLDRPARGERVRDPAAAGALRGVGPAGDEHGVRDTDWPGQIPLRQSSEPLQGGYRDPRSEACDRGRRPVPSYEEVEVFGRAEDCGLGVSRVESIEILEQGCGDEFAVYNIEVEGNHNYFADGVLVGNCHRLKSRDAKRTRAVYGEKIDRSGLIACAEVAWHLSGTPAPNHPAELWPMLYAAMPEAIPNPRRPGFPMRYWDFVARYCRTQENYLGHIQITGGKNLGVLKAALEPYVLRRKIEDVMADVPRLMVDTLPLSGKLQLPAGSDIDIDAVNEALDEHGIAGLAKIESRAAVLRRLTGLAKIDPMVAWVTERLEENDDKIVLMAHHVEVVERLRDGLRNFNPVALYGGATPAQKRDAAPTFANERDCRVFVGNMDSAGEAIDLSVADELVMVESSWVPGVNDQACMRVVNLAKKRPTLARFALLAGSYDERVAEACAAKTATIAEMFS